jgi:hypothetical protein
MIKILFCLSLFFHLSFSLNLQNNKNFASPQSIGDTKLLTDTHYYIKEKSGKYLRWDGNSDIIKGLYFDSGIKDNFQKDWFLFILEDNNNNNNVLIKNAKTNFYLQLYENSGFALFQDKSKVELEKATENDYFYIRSDGEHYMAQNSSFQLKNSITTQNDLLFDIYVIESKELKDKPAELTFEKVKKSTKTESLTNDDYISGTYLKRNTYYCIKSIDQKDEINFLQWDGKKSDNFYGLVLQTVSDNQCPDNEEFLFRIEGNKTEDFVKIRNKKTNSYISFIESKNFVLMDEKSSNSESFLKLISKNYNRINIRTRDYLSNKNDVSTDSHYVYLSADTYSTADKQIFMNIGIQNVSEAVGFEFIKSKSNAINFSILNWLLLNILSFVFVLKFLH